MTRLTLFSLSGHRSAWGHLGPLISAVYRARDASVPSAPFVALKHFFPNGDEGMSLSTIKEIRLLSEFSERRDWLFGDSFAERASEENSGKRVKECADARAKRSGEHIKNGDPFECKKATSERSCEGSNFRKEKNEDPKSLENGVNENLQLKRVQMHEIFQTDFEPKIQNPQDSNKKFGTEKPMQNGLETSKSISIKAASKQFEKNRICPNLYRVIFSEGKDELTPVTVMEYVNHDLLGVLGRKIQFSMQEVKIIFFQIVKGVSELHKRGFLHRDLKSEFISFKYLDRQRMASQNC